MVSSGAFSGKGMAVAQVQPTLGPREPDEEQALVDRGDLDLEHEARRQAARARHAASDFGFELRAQPVQAQPSRDELLL
jgi:hypothetical protein